jgi:tetratricopeptide (TPR) repeat protein
LQHPGIVPVYELGQLGGRPFYAMKLVKGQTLARLLEARTDPGQELPKLLQVFGQVCQAVGYAHARGVIHRDLKPANIMVGAFGEVLVMDWGLAKVLRRGGVEDERGGQRRQEAVNEVQTARSGGTAEGGSDTQAGSVLGTPGYMAPEQARGDRDLVDERADVFGLGATLCEILTGKPPFSGRNPEALRKAQTAALAEAFAALDGCEADAELVTLARRCLAAEPWERPRDGSAVTEAVEAYQRGVAERLRQAELERTAAQARAEGEAERLRLAEEGRAAAQARAQEEVKRRRLAVGLAAAVLVLVLAGGGSGVWWWQAREEIVRQVEAALAEADNERQAGRWPKVQPALERAQAYLAGGGPAYLRARAEQAARDADVVAALERVRLRMADVRDGFFDLRSTDERYAVAFREYGVDVDGPDPEVAAARLRRSAVRNLLVVALDEWGLVRREIRNPEGAARVRAVADRADEDDWRIGLRAALAADDLGRLKELASEAAGRHPGVQVVLSMALWRRGAVEDAVAMLLREQARHPADFWLAHNLAEILNRGKRSAEAEGYFRVALGLRPDSPLVWLNLGSALLRQGKLDDGVACCHRALELDPKLALAHDNLGVALERQGNLDEAMARHRRAIELDPAYALAHNNLGTVLHRQGKLGEAANCFRQAIQLNPKAPLAHNNLGHTLWKQGKVDGAITCFRRVLELAPEDPQAHFDLGVLLHQQKQWDDAVACYRQAIRLNPDLAPAHYNLGKALLSQGKFPDAVASCRRAIQLDPKNAQAHYNLGEALRRQGKLEEAAGCYRRAIEVDPKYAEAHDTLGTVLAAQGKPDEAADCFRHAIQLAPNLAPAHNNLGSVLEWRGKVDEAADCFRRAIQLDPNYALAHSPTLASPWGSRGSWTRR